MQLSVVRDGYNKMASKYLEERAVLKSAKYVQQLLKYLPKNSEILDLGCGAGVWVDDLLLKAGHQVRGIDISGQQIKLARQKCPGGEFDVGDMRELKLGEYQVQAVVSFYTLFHIPRVEQARLLKIFVSYLPKGGILLVTMGDREFEGEHVLYGRPMWSSQYGTAKNRQMMEQAGLSIIIDEIDKSGGERHQIIMGQKL